MTTSETATLRERMRAALAVGKVRCEFNPYNCTVPNFEKVANKDTNRKYNDFDKTYYWELENKPELKDGLGNVRGHVKGDARFNFGQRKKLGGVSHVYAWAVSLVEGGSPSDSLEPRTYADSIPIAYSLMFWNTLVEIGTKGDATPELAESWEAKPGAVEWVFNIRKGITFTSGKALDADDVIYSINLHRGETVSQLKGNLEPITDIKKITDTQIEITLSQGNADFVALLGDYHLLVVPDGHTDWANPIGTGAYVVETFEPGVRAVFKNRGEYWKPGRGNFDTVEIRYIADAVARTSALQSGQIDGANRLDPRPVDFLMQARLQRCWRGQNCSLVLGVLRLLVGRRRSGPADADCKVLQAVHLVSESLSLCRQLLIRASAFSE